MPSDRAQPKFQPLTVNLTDSLREGLQRIADREVVSLSDIARRAFRAEIERRDRAEGERDDV